MTILGKFKQQPNEILDYDVSYADFLSNRSDIISSVSVTAEPGIDVDSVNVAPPICKIVLSGGTNGSTYKITVRMTTTSGVVKEDEFLVTVKEI